jgi:hypothetical protein
VNAHLKLSTGERFSRYCGAAYGVDIVALDLLGNRANGFAPGDPAQYAIISSATWRSSMRPATLSTTDSRQPPAHAEKFLVA